MGGSEIIYRDARNDDVAAIGRLIEPFVEQRKLLRRDADEIAQLTDSGFVAEVAGQVVGFAAVELYSKKLAEVLCLAVAKPYQSQGVGKRLIELCIACAREHGVLELMAISSSDRFLMDCGFEYTLPDEKKALFFRIRPRE